MTLSLVTGDLFSSEAQVIGHGVNCKGLMGAGIARSFRDKFPDMYKEYKMMCKEGLLEPGDIYPYRLNSGHVVMNIASQEWPGPDAKIEWLAQGIQKSLTYMRERGLTSLSIPKIGCGIGGLMWSDVESTLKEFTDLYLDIDIAVYSLEP